MLGGSIAARASDDNVAPLACDACARPNWDLDERRRPRIRSSRFATEVERLHAGLEPLRR